MISTPQAKKGLYLASSLCDGVEDNNIKQVTTLLDSKEADPNVIIPIYGISPFHLAIGNSSESFAEEVTKLFLRHGGNPNVRSTEGLTPVHVAAAWGRCKVLELLLVNGGDPLLLDNEGHNPFHFAFDGVHYDAVTTLLKYCGDSGDEEEEIKYEIALEKLFINNKKLVAEYVISDEQSTETISTTPENFLEVNIKSKDGSSTSGSQININDDFVTRRRNQKIWKHTQENENTADITNTDLRGKTLQDEKILVSKIISRLSTSFSSDIKKADLSNNSSLFGKRMGLMSRETNPQNMALGDQTYAKVHKKSPQNFSKGRLKNNLKEEQNPIKPVSVPKTEKFRTRSPVFKANTTFFALDNSIVSKSPNCNILSRFEKKIQEKSPILDRQVLKSLNNSIVSKSPNCNIVSTLERKRKLAKTLSVEEHVTPKMSKKPLQKMISRTPCDVKSKLFKSNSEKTAQVSKSLPRNFHRACIKTPQERELPTFKKPIHANKKIKSTNQKDTEESSGVYSETSKISNLKNVAMKLENYMPEDFKSLSNDNDVQSTRLSENFDHDILISMIDTDEKGLNTSLENGTSQLSSESITRCDSSAKKPEKVAPIKSELDNNVSRFYDSTLDCKPFSISNVSDLSLLSTELKFKDKDKFRKIQNVLGENRENIMTDDLTERSFLNRPGGESFLSIEEEYKYKDSEEGVILLERRLCITPSCLMVNKEELTSFYTCSTAESISSLPQEMLFIDKQTLRQRLTDLGEAPGPITNSTHRVYLKRLMKLEDKKQIFKNGPPSLEDPPRKLETSLIKSSLLSLDWQKDLESYKRWENEIFLEFARPDPSRRWREGLTKASFNYLLLDSRITQDLPNRAANLSLQEKWETFLSAIFYVGKGKRSRPYAHLYDAFHTWVLIKSGNVSNKKIKRILEIWNEKQGVVVLHVFQNTIPVEAYTREAAMIDALGVEKLGNCKGGEYYGTVATWSNKEKCELGKYLLYKAMEILMVEGERHLFPEHL